jgi:hypothetical protein
MNERQRHRTEEMARIRQGLIAELEEAFGHRYDGLAAARRFQQKLRYYAAFISDGTVATSRITVLHELFAAERKLASGRPWADRQ